MSKSRQSKPQGTSEIKPFELSLDDAMQRLSLIVDTKTTAEILRWLEVKPSSYNNWKRNNAAPIKYIVSALLKRGLSVDAFFSPEEMLRVPEQLLVAEQAKHYQSEHSGDAAARALDASIHVQGLLQSAGIKPNKPAMRLLVKLWLLDDGKLLSRRDVVNVLLEHIKHQEDA